MIFLILMYTVNRSLGKFNDILNSLIGIESAILAGFFYAEYHDQSLLVNQVALALAVGGAIFTIIGSILSLFGITDFVLAGWYLATGNGFISLWLVILCYSLLGFGGWPHNIAIFGIVAGAFMAIGLFSIPGIFMAIDSMESLPWYLYIAFVGWFGTYILYPIWAIWLG